MICGPWLRSFTRDFLYTFSSKNDAYVLLVTDMNHVYEERLTADQIESRGDILNCPFALDSEHQRKAFGDILANVLASEKALFNVNVDSTVIVHSTEDVAFNWQFYLQKLPPDKCSEVFAHLAAKLFGVIGNLNSHISDLDERIVDGNAIIRGLENANSRQIQYNVPKTLEPVYNSAIHFTGSEKLSPDFLEVAERFWPDNNVALVESDNVEEMDSDVTHESITTNSSENVWSGSAKSTYHESI